MSNLFFTPAVPAADGVGAWTNVAAAGTKKTITVLGTFEGTVTIEVTNDGTGFHPVTSFTNAGDKTMDIPCQQMRVRRSGTVSGTPIVNIAAEDDGTKVANLPVSAGDGVGAAVDVSDYGNTMSILVAATWTGTVTIEISEDGTNWSQIKSFTDNGYEVMTFIANYMRVRRSGNSGGTPNVDVAAGNDADTLANLFGDGADGDVTLGAPISLARDMYYNSLDTDGNDINTAGFRIFVKDTLYVRAGSTIHRDGNAAVADAAGAALAAAMLGASGAGGAGQTGAGSAGGALAQCIGGEAGAGGAGAGGASAAGAAGVKTGLTTAEPTPQSLAFAQYPCDCQAGNLYNGGTGGGGGGGDGAADEGGGGGGGGGVVVIAANRIVIEATGAIQALGGDGADGTAVNAGGGGGGGGGAICLTYRALQNAGTISANGGTAGSSGGGTGADGADGDAGSVYQLQI